MPNDQVLSSKCSSSTSGAWKVPEVMAIIGPILEKPEDLQRAIQAEARWFRLPCGYRQRPHVQNARDAKAAASGLGIPVQLLADLPSSRPRTGGMQELRLSLGDHVLFWDPEVAAATPTQNGSAPVPLPGLSEFIHKLIPRQRMWFCDGRLRFVVDEVHKQGVYAHLADGCIALKSWNSLFLPDSVSPFCVITESDRTLLAALAAGDVHPDWVALSLISSEQDVMDGRREVSALLGPNVRIMAKIETAPAWEQAEAILSHADGLMVARGDLGLAVGYLRLPEVQEQLVALARRAGKPVVVATQAMEVFAETGLPQRAELSDLSLIARQRADALMLGKETVFSPRPIDCINFAREVLTHETRRFEKEAAASRR